MPTTAPVRDASGGAIVHGTNALTGVTQSLTSVPVNSVLYAWVFLDVGTGDTAATPAVVDNVGGAAWALIAERSKHSDGGAAQNGHISVFRKVFLAGGSIDVTASASGGSIVASTPISVNTEVITGGRIQHGVPEIAFEGSSTGTVKLPAAGLNPVGRYSYVRGTNVDWNAAANPTAAAGWTTRVAARPGAPNYTAWGADLVAQAAAQDVQFASTAPTSGTINNTIMVEHLPAFTPLANGAEDGTNTVAPVAATSGTVDNPWDAVTTSGGGAIVYSTDQAAHGTLSYKITSTATAGTAFTTWSSASIGRLDRIYGRFYLYAATNDAGLTFLRLRGNSTAVFRITMDAAGHLELRNSAGTVVATFTNAIANSVWVRVEFDVTPGVANGAAQVKLFNTTDSTTATETQSVSAQAFGIAYVDEVAWGQHNAVASLPTVYLDDVQINATGLPGPVGGGGPVDQAVTLTGVGTAGAVGAPAVLADPAPISLTGVASAAAVGAPAVVPGDVEVVLESAPTLSAVGEPLIAGDDVGVTLTGVGSVSAVGQPAVVPPPVTVALTGVGSGSTVGQPAVAVGPAAISLTGVASAAAVGQPVVAPGAVTVNLTGVGSGSGYGQPVVTLGLVVALTGVGSVSAVGQPTVVPPPKTVTLTGVGSGGAVGQPAVVPGAATVVLAGVSSASVFGLPALSGGVATVLLTGVPSVAGVGSPAITREIVDYGIRAAAHRVTMTVPSSGSVT